MSPDRLKPGPEQKNAPQISLGASSAAERQITGTSIAISWFVSESNKLPPAVEGCLEATPATRLRARIPARPVECRSAGSRNRGLRQRRGRAGLHIRRGTGFLQKGLHVPELLQRGFACRESRGGACCSHLAGHLLRFLGKDEFHGDRDFAVRPT